MLFYTLRRLISILPVMLIALTACFFILRLAPGGPFDQERPLPPAIRANLEAHYHLDKPLIEQYTRYLGGVLQGDLGPSFVSEDFSVSDRLSIGFPYTIKLGFMALIVAVILGGASGILGAIYQNRWGDYALAAIVMIGLVVPNFVIAPILQLVFGVQLGWLPVRGWGDGGLYNLTLPVAVLASSHIARISRLMRASMLEVLSSPYIRTARAKGIGRKRVVLRHAIKPALAPVVSYLGPAAGFLLTGSIVIENIFGLPGVGRDFITAALNRDYSLVLGTVIVYMALIVVLNLVVDLAYAWLDPKVRSR